MTAARQPTNGTRRITLHRDHRQAGGVPRARVRRHREQRIDVRRVGADRGTQYAHAAIPFVLGPQEARQHPGASRTAWRQRRGGEPRVHRKAGAHSIRSSRGSDGAGPLEAFFRDSARRAISSKIPSIPRRAMYWAERSARRAAPTSAPSCDSSTTESTTLCSDGISSAASSRSALSNAPTSWHFSSTPRASRFADSMAVHELLIRHAWPPCESGCP
jgi:hypothetical protein